MYTSPDKNMYKIGRAINRLRFKSNIWEKGWSNTGYPSFNRICQMIDDVRTLSGLEKRDWEIYKTGIECCNIFHWNYPNALEEFRRLCYLDF